MAPNPGVEDRVKSSKCAKELDAEPHMASLDELRGVMRLVRVLRSGMGLSQ